MRAFSELTADDWGKIALWGGLTVVAFIALAVVVFVLRRNLRSDDSGQTGGFDLNELQKMRDRGDIDEAEYKVLRTQAIASMMVETDKKR